MKHNRERLERFWYWISERHSIYIKKEIKKEPKPWTDDEVLRSYKFTNVFRRLDAGTVWLLDNFIHPHMEDEALLFFNITWYRSFNFIGTGEALGYLTDWNPDEVTRILKAKQAAGEKVFTSAHMITGYGYDNKVDRVVEAIMTPIWDELEDIWYELPNTIEDATKYLKDYTGFSGTGFMAYEVMTDLTYTPKLSGATDRMTWANRGPGALKGMRKIFGDYYKVRQEGTFLLCLRWLLKKTNEHFEGSHLPLLEMRDIEHSLCEYYKYQKTLDGEGRPRQRYDGQPDLQMSFIQ